MTIKKKSGFSKAIIDLVLLIPNIIRLIADLTTVIGFEVRKTGKSIFVLFILAFILAILICSFWFAALGLLFFYLISLHLSFMLSISVLLLSNFFLLGIVAAITCRVKKNLLQ